MSLERLEPIEIINIDVLGPYKYPKLVHDGYMYHFHKKCSHHLRWKCNRVFSMKCPAVLKTNLDMLNLKYITVDHEHVHGNDIDFIEAIKVKLDVHRNSTYYKRSTCYKRNDMDRSGYKSNGVDSFGKEMYFPENVLNNKIARFCATKNQIFFIDPLDLDTKNGNTKKCEEIIKNNNSKDTSINFENFPCDSLKPKENQNQIQFKNSKNGMIEDQTNNSSFNEELKECEPIYNTRSKKKLNDIQNNASTLFTSTQEEKNILTSNTYKETNNLTTNTRKIKNTKKKSNDCEKIVSPKVKLKNHTSKFTNKNLPTVTDTPMIISTPTILTTTINNLPITKNRFTTTNASTIINTPTIISTLIDKSIVTSTPTISTSETISTSLILPEEIICTPTITCIPRIIDTPTFTSTPIILPDKITSTSTILPDKIISISTITSTPTIISTSTITNTPTILPEEIICTPTILPDEILSTSTITSTPIIIDTPTITSASIILTPKTISTPKNFTHEVINTTTVTSTSAIISTPTFKSTYTVVGTTTIENSPAILSTSTILTSTIKSTPIVTSVPSVNITHTTKRRVNKSIDNEDDVIIINSSDDDNDDDDDGFISDFNEIVRRNDKLNNEINNVKLMGDDINVLMYCKKNWPSVLDKLSDPLTGIKVFEGILFNKFLIQMMERNHRTKRKIQVLKYYSNRWKLKFNRLALKINTLLNSTRRDNNRRLIDIQNRNKKNTTLCTNIGVKITPENLKTSKLCQKSLNSKNKYLFKSGSDIMTSKSEGISKKLFSTLEIVDLIKEIPGDTTISRISSKPFNSKENYLTQFNYSIEISQPKITESIKNGISASNTIITSLLSPTSLKRKISNLIRNNTSIELTKSKVKKCNKSSSLESIDLTMDSSPDMMASRLGPELLNSQITNSTQYNTATEMTESSITECHEPSTSALIDLTETDPPVITNSRLSNEKYIFTKYNKGPYVIPSFPISSDISSNIPTCSSSSMNAVTSLNNDLVLNNADNPASNTDDSSKIELLVLGKNNRMYFVNSKVMNSHDYLRPRTLKTIFKTGLNKPIMKRSVILPFALRKQVKTNSNTSTQLDKRNKLDTSVIPVQTKTPLPDVICESTQIINGINSKNTIQSYYSHNQSQSSNQIKSVPKAIPLLPSKVVNDFSNEV
ncbi:uncharacterized threonine-rich GPI-anchored glycoprotein PJ4664.02-like [Melanaphis sacchari]|uniref:uncharacterized threonine-rich GPI-anchored glycoprotein PJ4664.02-like n=1 Tax=Melanaphis sacchari TaxID=742174 RepID=UPI000DC139CF|nr:uncharacterized threonine-rich GPI-anchored glycoprotein PJ4664.02-like [Melanaphis sacchari]